MSSVAEKEPMIEVSLGTSDITLLGTAHVSHQSVEQVKKLLAEGTYDAVAVELCPSRYNAIIDPESLARMDLLQVIREGKASMVIANLAMGAYQQRLADQLGIAPGEEQKTAIKLAQQAKLPVLLIDREIGTTLKRTARNMPWWKRWVLFTGLLGTLISKDEVEEAEIERLKEGDILENTFAEFAQDRQDLFGPLIAERDQYMAARLAEEIEIHPHERILAVLGAGHLKGIANQFEQGINNPSETIKALDEIPPASRWPKIIPWLIVVLILGGFVIGFSKSADLGWELIANWVFINGGLSALGALIAGAHPLTIVTAFLAAPLTSLNPTIGAGMVTAAAEIYFRKPQVDDFSRLRHDTTTLKGWWHNRVSRTLLVFLLSTLGSAIGTYVAGFRIFERLSG